MFQLYRAVQLVVQNIEIEVVLIGLTTPQKTSYRVTERNGIHRK